VKATIVDNNGESNYTVSIPRESALLTAELTRVENELAAVERALSGAEQAYQEASSAYQSALSELDARIEGYNACVNSFSFDHCLSEKNAECNSAYNDCRDVCFDGPGEDRNACYQTCEDAKTACESRALIDCQTADMEHRKACRETHGPLVTAAQAEGVRKLAALKATAQAVSEWRVRQANLARRKTELERIESTPILRNTVAAQYDDQLQPGTEVDVLPYLETAYYISTIKSANPCPVDSRIYPSGHLLINSALATGAETWMPTYRRGTVLEQTDEGKLKVRIDPGVLPGTLGTRISRRNINCTPPQAYFDGDWQETETAIGEARDLLDAAQESLQQLYEDRQACIDAWDPAACYDPRKAHCESTWGQWLIDCQENGGSEACVTAAQEGLQSCLEAALADCAEQRSTYMAQCFANAESQIREAEQAVTEAQTELQNALRRIQQPAEPLELELEIGHCSASTYQEGDRVLIDFPVRTATTANPVAVWQSGRVIGWVEDPRMCSQIMLLEIILAMCYGHPVKDGGWTLGNAHELFEQAFNETLVVEYAVADSLAAPVVWQPMVIAAKEAAKGQVFYAFENCDGITVGHVPEMVFYSPARDDADCPQTYWETDEVYLQYQADCESEYQAACAQCRVDYGGDDQAYLDCLSRVYRYLLDCASGKGRYYRMRNRDGSAFVDMYTQFNEEMNACWSAYEAADGVGDPNAGAALFLCQQAANQKLQAAYAPALAEVQATVTAKQECLRNTLGAIPDGVDLNAPAVYGADGYWGVSFRGEGRIDCEGSRRTNGNPVQRYRISKQGGELIGEFTIHYVGLQPSTNSPVTQVQTDAILSPDITLGNSVPTPIVGLGAPPPAEP
jgi:hypothetical protein